MGLNKLPAEPAEGRSTQVWADTARNLGVWRNWDPIGAVTLNTERDCVIKAHLEKAIQPMAA